MGKFTSFLTRDFIVMVILMAMIALSVISCRPIQPPEENVIGSSISPEMMQVLTKPIPILDRSNTTVCETARRGSVNCSCPQGYDVTGDPACIPSVCKFATGVTLVGDVGLSDYEFCGAAVYNEDLTYCDKMASATSQDICRIAFVLRTHNRSACTQISDRSIKEACYG